MRFGEFLADDGTFFHVLFVVNTQPEEAQEATRAKGPGCQN